MGLHHFLLKYRNTPSTVTKEIPSNNIFKFKPLTLLEVMISKIKEENVEVYAEKQISVKQDERKIKSNLKNYIGNEPQFKKEIFVWIKHNKKIK